MDWSVEGAKQAPKDRGGAVAKDRSLAVSEDCGHPAPVEAQAAVANRVDAAVDAMELATIDAISNGASTQASGFQLPASEHAMLPRGNHGYLAIGRVDLLTHVGT